MSIKSLTVAFSMLVIIACNTRAESTASVENIEALPAQVQLAKKSLFEKLKTYNDLSVEEVIERYYQLKESSINSYNFEDENELNRYGYMLLWENKTKSAIEVFKLLVSEFPKSGNPYDSLGEAYMKDGNEELALLNYEKSIQINPDNNHAKDQVTILKGLELLVTDWGKEFFHFPLHFAEEIPYQGVEEVVFPSNWIKPDSSDFWSYVFVWALDNKQAITSQELAANLTLYFDGLIGGLSRVDSTKLTEANVEFIRNENPKDSVLFTGTLNIFDGFATQEPITLNARVYSEYCETKEQLILLFRFSPQAYEHPVWDLLRTVKVRETVCEL